MNLRIDERATGIREIDRFDCGFGWISHPDERMERASHALVVDGEVWVIDPVDAEPLDGLLTDHGDVEGVVVTMDRHVRDAAALATRHEVPVYVPDVFSDVAGEVDAPTVRFGSTLARTRIETRVLASNRFWQEVALYDPETGTLLVSESVGTASYFRADEERLGIHPMRRGFPPREALGDLDPQRVLVGHGRGILTEAAEALDDALANARTRAPRAYAETARSLLPI